DGAINNVRQRVNREEIVQVEDSNHKPVAGAVVLFPLPDQGPSGTFVDGSKMLTVMTDNQGRARVRMKPNNQAGQVTIRVTASFQGMNASAVIAQTNVIAAGSAAATAGLGAAKIWLIVGIAAGAGAAAGGIYYATHNGSSTTPVTVTPGTPSVGAP